MKLNSSCIYSHLQNIVEGDVFSYGCIVDDECHILRTVSTGVIPEQ